MSIARARHLRKSLTPQEAKLWLRLRGLKSLGLHFRRQVPVAGYYLDFACLKHSLAIEVDGSQHGMSSGIVHDQTRDDRLADLGFKTLRFWNFEIDRNISGVVERILIEIDPALVEDLTADRQS